MNIRSITTLGLVAVALAVTSITPAEANNNSNYLNQLAMQYYMQNQAAAANTNIYNPALAANYGYTGGPTPWSAGAIPGYAGASNPWAAGCIPYGTNTTVGVTPIPVYNNVAYGTVISPQYTGLGPQIGNLRSRLAANNLSGWQAARLQNQITRLQAQPTGLAATGAASAYGNRSGVLNNLHRYMHL